MKPYFFLEQTLQQNLPLRIPCTQFKTRLRARAYRNSLVERIKNNVRSQMKGRHFNKERQCGKNLPFVTTYHPALPNFKNILMSKWHLIKNRPSLREMYKHISASKWAAFGLSAFSILGIGACSCACTCWQPAKNQPWEKKPSNSGWKLWFYFEPWGWWAFK